MIFKALLLAASLVVGTAGDKPTTTPVTPATPEVCQQTLTDVVSQNATSVQAEVFRTLTGDEARGFLERLAAFFQGRGMPTADTVTVLHIPTNPGAGVLVIGSLDGCVVGGGQMPREMYEVILAI